MDDIRAMLIAQEGKRLKPYVDSVGKWTIGVGRNLMDRGISEEECQAMLDHDIADAIDDARALVPDYETLSRPRQMVLISMAFNLGRTRLARFVKFLDAVNRRDFEDAAQEMQLSNWYNHVRLRGVTLVAMMRDDVSEWV